MKKLTFLLLLALITGLRAIAVPAYPLPISVPQPDGTLVSIKLVGDEFYHFNTTADKLTKAQCALIAVSLPNPRRMNSARPSAYMLKRQKRILREMRFVKKL